MLRVASMTRVATTHAVRAPHYIVVRSIQFRGAAFICIILAVGKLMGEKSVVAKITFY